MKSFTELTAREKLFELLRWLCVLPAVVVAWYVGNRAGSLLVKLVMSIGLLHHPGDMSFINTCMRYLLWLFPDDMACIIAAAKTAPRCRLVTACVVAIAWSLLTDLIHRWEACTIIPTTITAVCGVAFIAYTERLRTAVSSESNGL